MTVPAGVAALVGAEFLRFNAFFQYDNFAAVFAKDSFSVFNSENIMLTAAGADGVL